MRIGLPANRMYPRRNMIGLRLCGGNGGSTDFPQV
jgi:hypothetical protein